jgi:hypothetical protein
MKASSYNHHLITPSPVIRSDREMSCFKYLKALALNSMTFGWKAKFVKIKHNILEYLKTP